MEIIVSINASTDKGKMLVRLLKEFTRFKDVKFLTDTKLEEMEDHVLGKLIDEGHTGKYVDVDNFLKELKSR